MLQERTVKVVVKANVAQAVAGVSLLRQGFKDFNRDLQIQAVNRKATFNDIGFGLGVIGAAVGGLTYLAVRKFAEFDQAMSHVAAVTRESAGNMALLRQAALLAGAETVFTAKEAAMAIEELAKAGVKTADILGGGLRASLNLAAASGLSVARAAEIAAGALGMFKLQGSDLDEVADMLAAGANKSIGEVDDLALALRQVGPVANQTGLSIRETVAALAAFASTGRIGLDAGTSFKRLLQLLTPQSEQAKAAINELGVSGYDAQGNFIGLANYAGLLQEKLKNLTPEARNAAFATMYGSDAVNAATEIYRQGADGIQEWINKVDDQGYAAENAKLRLGNLMGDIEQFKGSMDNLLVTMGSAANGPLRSIVQFGKDTVNALAGTSDSFQQAIFWAGAATSAVTVMGAAFFLAVPRVAAFHKGIAEVTAAMPRFGAALSAVGRIAGVFGVALIAISAITTGITAYRESLRLSGVEMTNMVSQTSGGINTLRGIFNDMPSFMLPRDMTSSQTGMKPNMVDPVEDFQQVLDRIEERRSKFNLPWDIDTNVDEVTTRFNTYGVSLSTLASTDLPKAQKSFRDLFAETDGSITSFKTLLSLTPDYRDALIELATTLGIDASDSQAMMNLAMGEGSEGAMAQKSALRQLSAAAADATGEIGNLADEVDKFGQEEFDTRSGIRKAGDAYRDLVASINEATEAGASHQTMLSLTSEWGSQVTGDMDAYASAINDAASAMFIQNGSIEQMTGYLGKQRNALYEVIRPLYETDAAAWQYINTLLATPEMIITQVKLNGLNMSQQQLDKWLAINNNRVLTIKIRTNRPDLNGWVSGTGSPGIASGGTIRGPGNWTSDTAGLFALSNGEEVIRAQEAEYWRPLLKRINSGEARRDGLASGGTAGQAARPIYATPRAANIIHRSLTIAPVIQAGAVGNEKFLGETVTTAIRNEIRRGNLPRDWQDN